MLFNSSEFILLFLPLTLIILYRLGAMNATRLAMGWLILASSIFYAWFSVKYLILLWALICFNFIIGNKLSTNYKLGQPKLSWLILGIVTNLSILGYFKYTNFLIANINDVFGSQYVFYQIILPIGISFFTFQKIGYLVDAYSGNVKEYDFLSFCLFVMFFPQLIAGPIVHHKDIIPQFRLPEIFKFTEAKLVAGLLLFTMGLVKKIGIADKMALLSDDIFNAVKNGTFLGLYESWRGALAFTFQIYFDFSGYTDMALGLALMCGIYLPLNFNSPYVATNIIDFWRRWHMSLSKFMRDYIYIPLGGNRKGSIRRYINLFLTMLIGGLWHGASWTFVIWGGLHGCYLTINHGWQAIRHKLGLSQKSTFIGVFFARVLTFFAVVVAWIFFRAENFHQAFAMLQGMAGLHGILGDGGQFDFTSIFTFSLLIGWVWLMPNSQTLISAIMPKLKLLQSWGLPTWTRFVYQFSEKRIASANGSLVISVVMGSAVAITILVLLAYQAIQHTVLHQFIYFQF